MSNRFLEKTCAKYGRKSCSRPFYKKSKLVKPLDQQYYFFYSFFILYVQVDDYQNIETKVQSTWFQVIQRFFKKRERGLELLSLHHEFWRKYLSRYISLTDQMLLSDCLYFLRYFWDILFHILNHMNFLTQGSMILQYTSAIPTTWRNFHL